MFLPTAVEWVDNMAKKKLQKKKEEEGYSADALAYASECCRNVVLYGFRRNTKLPGNMLYGKFFPLAHGVYPAALVGQVVHTGVNL